MKKIIIIFTSILIIAVVSFGIYSFVRFLRTDVFLSAEKKSYLHWEFVQINARIKNKKFAEKYKNEPFYASVFRGNDRIITIGGLGRVPLTYNNKKNLWEGKWPCPWNAPDGKYYARPLVEQNIKFSTKKFLIKHRKLKKYFPKGFGVLTYEKTKALSKTKIINPDDKETDWRGMLDWTQFIGADAFWYLAVQTAAERQNPDEYFPWIERNLSKLPELGIEAHNRNLKFGAYIIAYLTFGQHKYKNYRYAYDYNSEKGGPVETTSISISDEKRVADIIKLVNVLNDIPEVDYIGLDYIRNALGGYELVDEFVEEMNIKVPDGWQKFNPTRRMAWLANEKVLREDKGLIDQWQWWLAHKVSKIINRITTEVKLKKPLWLFTLTWKRGWQHGQDPIMFADAGADIDALMLYEADRRQFDVILNDWHNYVKKGQSNVMVGNVVDWPLHQRTLNPPGPEEFYNRLIESAKEIYNDGIAEGMFVHDLSRALSGRIKPYTSKEWLLAGASAITEMRRLNGVLPVTAKINLSSVLSLKEEFQIQVMVKNISSKKQDNLCIKIHLIGGEVQGENEKIIANLLPNETQTISFSGLIKSASWGTNLKHMVAVQIISDKRNATFFKYVTAK